MRSGLVTLAVSMLAGCAHVPTAPDGPIRLAPDGPRGNVFEIVDGRDPAAIAGGTFEFSDEGASYLGDERFAPSRMSVLASSLHECCAAQLDGKGVKVTDFEVSLRASRATKNSAGPVFVPYAGSAGATVVAGLIGMAVIHGIEQIGSRKASCARIRIEVESSTYSAGACEPVESDAVESMRKAFQATLERLAADIRSQPPGAQ